MITPRFAFLIFAPGLVLAQTAPTPPQATAPNTSPPAQAAAVPSAALAPQSSVGLQNPVTTVYLQSAESFLSTAATEQAAKPMYGSPAYMQMQSDIQNYTNNMNSFIDAANTASAPAREYHRLLAVADRAAKTKDQTERKDLLGNFLYDSRIYLKDHPEAVQIWVVRAAACLQVNNAPGGQEAARVLASLPVQTRDDPHVKKLLGLLVQKGWLAQNGGAPGPVAK